MNAINDRRSIRKFKTAPVPKETIADIIEAGRSAPSAKNRQPWKYIVYSGNSKNELLDKMETGLDKTEKYVDAIPKELLADARNTLRIMREAPVVIMVLNTNGTSPFIPTDPNGRITEICDSLSIGASIQNILLKAHETGLGTLWIANTFYAYEELANYIGSNKQLICAIALGYPDECPNARPRKNIEDILEFRY